MADKGLPRRLLATAIAKNRAGIGNERTAWRKYLVPATSGNPLGEVKRNAKVLLLPRLDADCLCLALDSLE